eukprot:scaffold2229_cov262-Pinguiococcus_pyrenoidosus.AAC.13
MSLVPIAKERDTKEPAVDVLTWNRCYRHRGMFGPCCNRASDWDIDVGFPCIGYSRKRRRSDSAPAVGLVQHGKALKGADAGAGWCDC